MILRFCGLLLNGFFLAPKSLYDILVRSCVCFNVNQWNFCYESGGKPKSYSKLLCTYSRQTAFILHKYFAMLPTKYFRVYGFV